MLKEKEYNVNFEQCYKNYALALTKLIYKKIKNWDTANDLTQEIFLKLFSEKIPLDINVLSTLPFLYKIATNITIDFLRKHKKRDQKTIKYIDEINLINAFKNNPEESYLKGEVISSLYDIVKSFPEKEQDIFYLKHFNQKKLIEISREKNLCYYEVRKNFKKINNKIKENLEDYFKDQ